MLQTLDEVKKVELDTTGIINGVDNANLMSVDSTTPIQNEADEVSSEEKAAVGEKEEKEEKTVEGKGENNEVKTEEEKELETKSDEELDKESAVSKVEKDPVEKRIGKLTKKWRSAERDRDYQKTKRLEVEAELKKLKLTIPTTDKPVAEDFEDTATYLEALTEWKVDQRLNTQLAEMNAETEEVKDKQTADDIEEELETVADRGRDKYDDYDELVFDKDLTLTQGMIEVIILSDIAEEILYYLGKHPEMSETLSEMSTLKAAKELGKLEVEIAAAIPNPNASSEGDITPEGETKPKATPKKKTTKTPEPIVPVKATGVTEQDPLKMSPKEYRAWRESNKE